MLSHKTTYSLAFTAQNNCSRRSVIPFGVVLLCVGLDTDNPYIALLKIFNKACHIAYACDGKMLNRACRCFGYNVSKSNSVSFGNKDTINTGGFRSADYCAQVVWVFDTIENN